LFSQFAEILYVIFQSCIFQTHSFLCTSFSGRAFSAPPCHDAASACLGRLRSSGLNVVDRLRPRAVDDLSVNHGGGVVFSAADLALKPVPVDQPSTFELICARAVVLVVVAPFRPL